MPRFIAMIAFLISSLNISAFASEDLNAEEWNPSSAGPVTTWTSPLCGKGEFVIQPFIFYNKTKGEFNADGKYYGRDSKYQYQEQLFAQ
jgi:hypothetical protein